MDESHTLKITDELSLGGDGCLYRNGMPIINPAEQLTPDDLQRVERVLQQTPAARQKMVEWQEANVDKATESLDLQRTSDQRQREAEDARNQEAQQQRLLEEEELRQRLKAKQDEIERKKQEEARESSPLADAVMAAVSIAGLVKFTGNAREGDSHQQTPGEAMLSASSEKNAHFGEMSKAAVDANRQSQGEGGSSKGGGAKGGSKGGSGNAAA